MILNLKKLFTPLQDTSSMKNYLLLLFLVPTLIVNAQLKQKTADILFKNMEYAKCVDMYDELIKKQNKKGTINWENYRKAAICHYQLFHMDKAISNYDAIRKSEGLSEVDYEMYINALRYRAKYDQSIVAVEEATGKFPNNQYFTRLNAEKNDYKRLLADSLRYKIKLTSINSGFGDFAPSFYNEDVVYATKSSNRAITKGRYGWDDAFYINLMQAKPGPDSLLVDNKLLKKEFLSGAHDGPVAFNGDLTKMVITKNKLGKKNGKDVIVLSLYFSEFIDGKWSDLVPFEYNNPDYNFGHGVFSEDGTKLYFVSDMPGSNGEADIYVSRLENGKWGSPENLGNGVNTEKREMFPFVQGSKLFFASDGHFGLGGLDIFEANLDDLKSKPINMGYPVNTAQDDFGWILRKDGETGYMSSNRKDDVDKIYAVRYKPVRVKLEGMVYEKYRELEPSPDQPVMIQTIQTGEIAELVTDSTGFFSHPIFLNESYRIYTEKQDFILLDESNFNTMNLTKDSTFYSELVLKPTTIILHLKVVEKGSRKPLERANASVMDYFDDKDTMMLTNLEGMVTMVADRNKTYWAHGSKKGYIDTEVSFNSENESGRIYELELALPPIAKGEKFKLENIFYDLNKSTLRPESKSSLDKLADFIIKNNVRIELSAHTDSRGSDSYNQRLSQARAQSCVNYLLTKGVRKDQIIAKGYGETQLVNGCKNGVTCPENEHQENRRTEVKILDVLQDIELE